MDNDVRELIDKLNDALCRLAEAASEAARNHEQYRHAWLEAERMWNEATLPLERLVARTGIDTLVCIFENNPVWLGDWLNQPMPPMLVRTFLCELVQGVNEKVKKLQDVNESYGEALQALRELAKALAPEVAMQKLAGGYEEVK